MKTYRVLVEIDVMVPDEMKDFDVMFEIETLPDGREVLAQYSEGARILCGGEVVTESDVSEEYSEEE